MWAGGWGMWPRPPSATPCMLCASVRLLGLHMQPIPLACPRACLRKTYWARYCWKHGCPRTIAGSVFLLSSAPPTPLERHCSRRLPHRVKACPTALLLQLLERLAAQPAGTGVPFPKLLYTIPTAQNPTGASITPARRRAVYDICSRWDGA